LKIKEIEEKFGISRANIRFYEKEGLLHPNRNENKYRDYSDNDVAIIGEIIILRKLDMSLSDIKEIFSSKLSLIYAIEKHKQVLLKRIEALDGAINICEQIEKSSLSIDSMDSLYYLNQIEEKEKNGLHFNNVFNDWINLEKDIFYRTLSVTLFPYFKDIKHKKGLLVAWLVLLLVCVLRGLSYRYIWNHGTFIEGFIYPFILFAAVSIILLPIFLVGTKRPKIAYWILMVLAIVGIVILIAVFLLLIVLILNRWLHFWF